MGRYSYSYKPTPIVATRPTERTVRRDGLPTRLFGLELEIDRSHSTADINEDQLADLLHGLSDRVYCKSDGSLYDGGCEMVTHPSSLAYWTYESNLRALTSAARKHGYRSHSSVTCGLHIHVNRESLGHDEDEILDTSAKILGIMTILRREMKTFSRRQQSQMRWCAMPITHTPTESECLDYVRQQRHAGHASRYVAINYQNDHTVEFRLWRGTLNRDTIIATLQLTDIICECALNHTWDECMALTHLWELANEHPYKELNGYLIDRNLATDAELLAPLINSSHRTNYRCLDMRSE